MRAPTVLSEKDTSLVLMSTQPGAVRICPEEDMQSKDMRGTQTETEQLGHQRMSLIQQGKKRDVDHVKSSSLKLQYK